MNLFSSGRDLKISEVNSARPKTEPRFNVLYLCAMRSKDFVKDPRLQLAVRVVEKDHSARLCDSDRFLHALAAPGRCVGVPLWRINETDVAKIVVQFRWLWERRIWLDQFPTVDEYVMA